MAQKKVTAAPAAAEVLAANDMVARQLQDMVARMAQEEETAAPAAAEVLRKRKTWFDGVVKEAKESIDIDVAEAHIDIKEAEAPIEFKEAEAPKNFKEAEAPDKKSTATSSGLPAILSKKEQAMQEAAERPTKMRL